MSTRLITPATYVTITRFFLVPVFITYFIAEKFEIALIVLGITAFTDLLDGWLARSYNMRSKLGAALDPLADKFLMLVSFITLSNMAIIPLWLTNLVIGRDVFIVSGALMLHWMKIKLYFKATILSKANTAFQIFTLIGSFVLAMLQKRPPLGIINLENTEKILPTIYTITASLTALTFLQYGYIGYKFWRYGERNKK